MLYKVVLTFKPVYETLLCDHSNESYWAVLFCVTVYGAQVGSNLEECRLNQSVWPQIKAIEQYFYVVLFIMLYKVVLSFKSVDETLVCGHSDKSYWAVLSCGTVFMLYKVVLMFKGLFTWKAGAPANQATLGEPTFHTFLKRTYRSVYMQDGKPALPGHSVCLPGAPF